MPDNCFDLCVRTSVELSPVSVDIGPLYRVFLDWFALPKSFD
ncbi:hypothetical protein BN903_64 [Halorubrum sp. AJ67]|nr:hypothetical protein BN903_64 [Halorubrum sp. AJ67]